MSRSKSFQEIFSDDEARVLRVILYDHNPEAKSGVGAIGPKGIDDEDRDSMPFCWLAVAQIAQLASVSEDDVLEAVRIGLLTNLMIQDLTSKPGFSGLRIAPTDEGDALVRWLRGEEFFQLIEPSR